MVVEIAGDGTVVFELPAGVYRLDIEGTLASGFSAALKSGSARDGSNHAAHPDKEGTNIVFSGSTPRYAPLIQGAGLWSLVVTGFGASTDVAAVLRKSSVDSF